MEQAQKTVSLKELREHMEEYIDRVNNGESFTVLRRSKPVFTLGPVGEGGADEDWETVIDFTKMRKSGVPLSDVREAIKNLS